MKLYQISLDESKRLLEDFKVKEEKQSKDAELVVTTFERCCQMKDLQLRAGLSALDQPILA